MAEVEYEVKNKRENKRLNRKNTNNHSMSPIMVKVKKDLKIQENDNHTLKKVDYKAKYRK